MAEYTQQELMKMQQEAMRRVNEMNERARRSLHSTPTPGHSQAAPQFERAPARRAASAENGQDTAPGSARTPAMKNTGHAGRSPGAPNSTGMPGRTSQQSMGGGREQNRTSNPGPAHPPVSAPAPAARPHPAPASGIARFFNLRQIFQDADTPLILAVLLLLYTENDDPLLMMALVYIML